MNKSTTKKIMEELMEGCERNMPEGQYLNVCNNLKKLWELTNGKVIETSNKKRFY